jgi:hypothetical protein
MTANVKSGAEIFLGLHDVFSPSCLRRAGASNMRRLLLLLAVGWGPPSVRPSGACLTLGSRMPEGALHAVEGDTTPGLRLCQCPLANFLSDGGKGTRFFGRTVSPNLCGNGPHKAHQLTGNGHGDPVGLFAVCHESSVAFTDDGSPSGGSGFWEANPRHVGGHPPVIGSHYVSASAPNMLQYTKSDPQTGLTKKGFERHN